MICLLNDRRRSRRRKASGEIDYEELGDDEISPLPPSAPLD
jgi:hypothetical protein